MDKKIRELFLQHGSVLYNKEWVEKVADEGFDDFISIFNESLEGENAKYRITRECNFRFGLLYYGAFEHAVNMIIHQIMKDNNTELEFYMEQLNKVVAIIKKFKDKKY